MNSTAPETKPLIEWAAMTRPAPGQQVCGDQHLVRSDSRGALLAVVDGLGHGEAATVAARGALDVLERRYGASVLELMEHCHRALLQTRGVVMTLAWFDAVRREMTWLGVGNVEGRLVRADPAVKPRVESLLLRSGVVGYQLPGLQADVVRLARNDLLLLATDGVHPDFAEDVKAAGVPQEIAQRILKDHFRGADDGLVLAGRYLGPSHEF